MRGPNYPPETRYVGNSVTTDTFDLGDNCHVFPGRRNGMADGVRIDGITAARDHPPVHDDRRKRERLSKGIDGCPPTWPITPDVAEELRNQVNLVAWIDGHNLYGLRSGAVDLIRE